MRLNRPYHDLLSLEFLGLCSVSHINEVSSRIFSAPVALNKKNDSGAGAGSERVGWPWGPLAGPLGAVLSAVSQHSRPQEQCLAAVVLPPTVHLPRAWRQSSCRA